MAEPADMKAADSVGEWTGLPMIHEVEGAEAVLEPAAWAGPMVINYYFPVEIVIVGGLPEEVHHAIQARVWEKLGDALERLDA